MYYYNKCPKKEKRGKRGTLTLDYGFDPNITHVIGIDEVGWGAIAGPLWVGGFVCSVTNTLEYLNVKDSKKYSSPLKRELVYNNIHHLLWDDIDFFSWPVDSIEVAENPSKALARCQLLVAETLLMERPNSGIILDGTRTIPELNVPQKAIISADSKYKVVSAASVLAKVERDNYMQVADDWYPGYGFGNHKGYATKQHLRALKELGVCDIHRKNVKCVRDLL